MIHWSHLEGSYCPPLGDTLGSSVNWALETVTNRQPMQTLLSLSLIKSRFKLKYDIYILCICTYLSLKSLYELIIQKYQFHLWNTVEYYISWRPKHCNKIYSFVCLESYTVNNIFYYRLFYVINMIFFLIRFPIDNPDTLYNIAIVFVCVWPQNRQ